MAPGLKVALNGAEIVTISADGLNMLAVRVHGNRLNPEFAVLDVSGGLYGEEQETKHLLWEAERELSPGDEVAVTLLEQAATSRSGKTIDELFPEAERPQGPPESLDQLLDRLAKEPTVREGFAFTVTTPLGDDIRARTRPEDDSFGFSVLWVWLHPECAGMSLGSNTLKEVAKRESGPTHAKFDLSYGETVKLRVNALGE
jgi:hypothetical protein